MFAGAHRPPGTLPYFGEEVAVADANSYHCPRCGKGYRWRQSMLSHQRFECGTERRFVCSFCPHRAQRRHHLQKHMHTVHPEEMQ